MAFVGNITETVIDRTIRVCIDKFYCIVREKEMIGKATKDEWRSLNKLKVMYHLSFQLGLTEAEKKKIFCFINECKQIKV